MSKKHKVQKHIEYIVNGGVYISRITHTSNCKVFSSISPLLRAYKDVVIRLNNTYIYHRCEAKGTAEMAATGGPVLVQIPLEQRRASRTVRKFSLSFTLESPMTKFQALLTANTLWSLIIDLNYSTLMKQISRDNKMYNKFKATERRDSDNMSPQIVVRRLFLSYYIVVKRINQPYDKTPNIYNGCNLFAHNLQFLPEKSELVCAHGYIHVQLVCAHENNYILSRTSQKLIVCAHRISNSNLYLMNMVLEISEVFESRRGNICISINNFKFIKYCVLKSGDFYFRCTNKKCNGLYVVNKLYTKVIQVINDHSKHSEYSAKEIEKEMIRSVVKRNAETELHIQPSKIIRQTLHLNPVTVRKPYLWLRINCSQTSGNFVPKQAVFLIFVRKPVPPFII
ncbi:hypothetical protein QTP88_005350 [Uroleucon formosanum]